MAFWEIGKFCQHILKKTYLYLLTEWHYTVYCGYRSLKKWKKKKKLPFFFFLRAFFFKFTHPNFRSNLVVTVLFTGIIIVRAKKFRKREKLVWKWEKLVWKWEICSLNDFFYNFGHYSWGSTWNSYSLWILITSDALNFKVNAVIVQYCVYFEI